MRAKIEIVIRDTERKVKKVEFDIVHNDKVIILPAQEIPTIRGRAKLGPGSVTGLGLVVVVKGSGGLGEGAGSQKYSVHRCPGTKKFVQFSTLHGMKQSKSKGPFSKTLQTPPEAGSNSAEH